MITANGHDIVHYGDRDPAFWADESDDPEENRNADIDKMAEHLCGNCPF